CESPAFINARLEACKNDAIPNAACSVAGALARTNYVTDLDANPASLYVDDTYVDDSSVLKEGVVVGGLTLNDVGYTADSPTDQSASGFALAYIPEVRDGDRIITTESRYYAGLLAATDVGPDFYNPNGTAEWTGKLSLVNKGVLSDVADFTLDINFDTRTIGASDERTHTTYKIETYRDNLGAQQERSVADKIFPVKVDYAHTTLGQFFINGKFTTKGVIYGTTRLVNDGGFRITEPTAENGLTKAEATSVLGLESSRGSLTGVIGQNGAVGAFISSGSGNTFGEYAGGFVAAPEFDCTTNPLDIRCNHPDNYAAREVHCGGYQENPACLPVLERVCDENRLFGNEVRGVHPSAHVFIDCGRAPLTLELRTAACRISTEAPNDCRNTINTVCGNNIFDTLCDGGDYASTRYSACSLALDGNPATGDIKDILKCGTLIARDCEADPFNTICYLPGATFDRYKPARVAECADHNFAASNDHCGDKENSTPVVPIGAFGPRVNVIGDYCTGLANPATDDKYELCNDKSEAYLEWRNADNNGVTGYRSAKANDVGLIAGGKSKLNLGDGATSVGNEMTLFLSDSTTNGAAIASARFGGQLQFYGGLLSGADVGAPVA
nr:hypothetical protein [Pseudomonadota bacterium]